MVVQVLRSIVASQSEMKPVLCVFTLALALGAIASPVNNYNEYKTATSILEKLWNQLYDILVGTEDQDVIRTREPELTELDPKYKDGNFFEGDLAIGQGLIDTYYGDNHASIESSSKLNAVTDSVRLWPNKVIPYMTHTSFDSSLGPFLAEAIMHWNNETCLTFVERTDEENYLGFTSVAKGCFITSVGYAEGGVWINFEMPYCSGMAWSWVMMHYIGHAVGLWHEQTRSDRDLFVDIFYENVASDKMSAFDKRTDDEATHFSLEYDYGSMMHSSVDVFSKNGKDTMYINNPFLYAKQGSPRIGIDPNMTKTDRTSINMLYACRS